MLATLEHDTNCAVSWRARPGSFVSLMSLYVLLLGFVQNLLTLAQVPSFWIQAIYGAIILGSLMVARITGGEAHE